MPRSNQLLREELGLDGRPTVYGELVVPVDWNGPDLRLEAIESSGRRFVQLDVCVARELPSERVDEITNLVAKWNRHAVGSRFVYVEEPQVYALCELPLAELTSEALLVSMRQLVDSAAEARNRLAERVPDPVVPLSRWDEGGMMPPHRFGKALVEVDAGAA